MRTTTLASAALLAARPIFASDLAPHSRPRRRWRRRLHPEGVLPAGPQGRVRLGPGAPCISIDSIAKACQPSGTSPLALEAHAQCMCGGSYFSDYLGCQRCLVLHGARSERDDAYWASVLAVASSALCTGTPTASFPKIFESAGASVVGPTTGGTASSDAKSGETAVSLYYTAKGSQGPGSITGSATGATAKATSAPTETGSPTTGRSAKTTSGSGSSSDSDSSAATTEAGDSTAASSSTTPTGNVAAATGVAGAKGLLMAMAGGALVAAL
ncbi:collagen-like protein mcl1 protein [Apiospora hydei]|uniref:Collagen-like protein mcl1 protein n=1 Tax=Apiospora hydei TaxID=1337664 RepID=A0ABR1WYA3_9PEZI